MERACPKLELLHYADDTTAFIQGKDFDELQTIINDELQSVQKWLECNRLTLNIQKSSYMIFGSSEMGVNLSVNGINLEKVDRIKFLGVHFDNMLTFKYHYEHVLSKLSQVAGLTYRSKYILPKSTLKSLYLSLGWSHISYGIVIWGKSSRVFETRINKVQDRIVKNLYGRCNDETYRNNKLMRFSDAVKYFGGIKLYKELNFPINPYFRDKISSLQSNFTYQTRFISNQNITPPLFIRARCHSSFLFQSISFWNTLPVELKESATINSFKRNLRNYMLSL